MSKTAEDIVSALKEAQSKDSGIDEAAATIEAILSPRERSKPDISGLPDATLEGKPIFSRGDRIVIERYNGILTGNPYLDTKTFLVNGVDMETGKVTLFDESLLQHATDNWRAGLARGQVYKFAHGLTVTTKRKRGRPRKNPVVAAPEATTPAAPKKRGRPKGSKNRDKSEIAAEKAEARKLRAAKAAARAAKKGGRK